MEKRKDVEKKKEAEKRIELYRCEDEVINAAYDRAVVNIYLQREKNGYKSFLLCGSEAGVGTTSISVELAISLSVAGWRTILVDGDMRKENKYKRLNENANQGLTDYIFSEAKEEDCVYPTNWGLLNYIPCGSAQKESSVRMLCSVRMGELMEKLEKEYDFVIIDAPSLNSTVDAKILTARADATILVTALHSSTYRYLEEARKQILSAGGNLIGVIENKVDMDEYKKYIKDYDYFKNKKFIKTVNGRDAEDEKKRRVVDKK